ncbi:MAG: alpha/beta fold hydrolase [Acutalibacteraceae bacterium]
MKNILIHGLGQNSKDWDTIKNELETREISPIVPDLFDLTKGRELDYPTVYQAFSEMSESYKDKLNLCGLSLGGLLALNYAIQYPKKINSLVLIGTPFEIPKGLLKFQNFVFKLIPKSAFQNMGVSKKRLYSFEQINGGTELYGVGGNARLPYSYSLRRKG